MVVRREGVGVAIYDGEREEYRYRLTRRLKAEGATCHFLMLNPSTATENVLDRTVARCYGYAQRWGYAGLIVTNIFALRSRDPKALYAHPAPEGPLNDTYILEAVTEADLTVCAWGTHGGHRNRGAHVRRLLSVIGRPLHALHFTQGGHPGHPLYLPSDRDPFPFTP